MVYLKIVLSKKVTWIRRTWIKVSPFLSCERTATPVLVLSLLRTCDQNIFGLLFDWIPIFLSNSLFDLSIIALTLFLALVYACRTFSASETFKAVFDWRRTWIKKTRVSPSARKGQQQAKLMMWHVEKQLKKMLKNSWC